MVESPSRKVVPVYHESSPRAGCPRFLLRDAHMPQPALLLVAHGSRNAEANADLLRVADELKQRGHAVVEPAFLELSSPTIADAASVCIQQGAERVILVPYFLSAGVHVRRDLSAACDDLSRTHPGVSFLLADPLGPHPLLLDIIAERV